MSMLLALDNGYQACMMAPTEILANQHYEKIKELLFGMDIRVELLTGSIKGKRREDVYKRQYYDCTVCIVGCLFLYPV